MENNKKQMITIPPSLSPWDEVKYLLNKYNNLKQSTPTKYFTITNDSEGMGYVMYLCHIDTLQSGLTKVSSDKKSGLMKDLNEVKQFLISKLEIEKHETNTLYP
jgi:hypothetical protein